MRLMRGRKWLMMLAVVLAGFAGVMGASADTYAADTSSTMKKWVFTGYRQCAMGSGINTPLTTYDHRSGEVAKDVMKKEGTVNLPSYQYGHSVSDGKVNCYDLFMGVGGLNGVLSYSGGSSADWSRASDTNKFLVDKLKYNFNGDGQKFFTITAVNTTTNIWDADGSVVGVTTNSYTSGRIVLASNGKYTVQGGRLNDQIKISVSGDKLVVELTPPAGVNGAGQRKEFNIDTDITRFAQTIANGLNGLNWGYSWNGGTGLTMQVKYSFNYQAVDEGENGEYVYDKSYNTTNAAVKGMSEIELKDMNLDNNERYNLYANYLKKAVAQTNGNLSCSMSADEASGDNYQKVKLKTGGEHKECYVSLNGPRSKAASITVYDLAKRSDYTYITSKTLQQVIDWLNNVNESTLTNVDDIMSTESSSGDLKELCYKAGVDDQGWFLCPTLTNMTYTATGFDRMIQDWLSVDTKLYDNNSNTHTVWEIMRNIANVLMIILLLVVIFSQLTGYGIDNYGIKKMLPRLITMAMLINLSFVICELAVDLSNILGVGLRNMFGSIGNALEAGQTFNGTDFIAGVVTTILATATGAGAVLPTVISAATIGGPMAVVIIILALLAVVAAVLLFFAALGARMIMIILCIAVAPVAFALFILPNTQVVFKKWWSVFKTALIMFPICGALGGISALVKGMVGDTDNVWMLVVALIAPFLVFFLLPMLLKGAIATLGQIGGALQTMGQSFTGGMRNTAGAIQSSEAFKERAQYDRERTAANRARRIRDSLASGAKNGTLSNRQMARYARASHRVASYEAGREKMFGEAFDRNERSENAQAFANSMRGGDAERASAAFTSLIGQGGTDEALTAAAEADWDNMDAGVSSRLLQTMGESDIDAFKAYAKYRQTGGKAGFQAWADGSHAKTAAGAAEANNGVKNVSYAEHLKEMGSHAMDNYDKDQMEFVARNAVTAGGNGIQNGMDPSMFGAMLGNAAVNSKDPRAQSMAEDAIRDGIARGTMSVDQLGMTADMIGSMRAETATAMYEGLRQQIAKANPTLDSASLSQAATTALRNSLSTQISAVQSDERIRNRTNQATKRILGIT